MDGTKTTTNWIIAGLVALAVIIGGGWLIARERSGASTTGMASSTVATSTETTGLTKGSTKGTAAAVMDATASASGEHVTVLDQSAGDQVIVADIALTKPTWIVIRDTNKWALGAAWFSESTKSVVVPLLRKTVPGHTYEAVMYVDDGDKQFAVHGSDMMIMGSEGAPVSSTFTAK